jgi:hypothetical protein
MVGSYAPIEGNGISLAVCREIPWLTRNRDTVNRVARPGFTDIAEGADGKFTFEPAGQAGQVVRHTTGCRVRIDGSDRRSYAILIDTESGFVERIIIPRK